MLATNYVNKCLQVLQIIHRWKHIALEIRENTEMFFQDFFKRWHNIATSWLLSQLQFLPHNILNRRFSSFYRSSSWFTLTATEKYWLELFGGSEVGRFLFFVSLILWDFVVIINPICIFETAKSSLGFIRISSGLLYLWYFVFLGLHCRQGDFK